MGSRKVKLPTVGGAQRRDASARAGRDVSGERDREHGVELELPRRVDPSASAVSAPVPTPAARPSLGARSVVVLDASGRGADRALAEAIAVALEARGLTVARLGDAAPGELGVPIAPVDVAVGWGGALVAQGAPALVVCVRAGSRRALDADLVRAFAYGWVDLEISDDGKSFALPIAEWLARG